MNILIRIRRIHCIYRCHQTGCLIYRVTVADNIFKDYTELRVPASLKPLTQLAAIQIAAGYALVFCKHRDKFINLIGNKITFRVDNETAILKIR